MTGGCRLESAAGSFAFAFIQFATGLEGPPPSRSGKRSNQLAALIGS